MDQEANPQGVASHLSSASWAESEDNNRISSAEKHVDSPDQVRREVPAELPTGGLARPSPPPDGGVLAWLHVLSAFLLWFNSWGFLNAFGVFQTYYESGKLFKASSSNISWIGAIQSFTLLFVGIIAGPMYDRGYLRTLLFVGSFGVVFGHMMLSLCKEYWQALLAQGFCVGIGAGCLFVASVSVLPTYFSKNIGLAIGLGSSGSSIGGIIYPIVLYRLIDRIGFAWSVRVMAFIALTTLLLPLVVMRMRLKPPKPRAIIDWQAFSDVPFMVFVLGSLLSFMGLNVILFYLSYVAEARHITSTKIAFYIVSIFNAGSTFGRTVPNALSDTVGVFNLIAPCALITGVLILCMMAVKSEAAIVVVAILIGFFSGVLIAMPPVCFVKLTHDKTKIGTRVGMGFGMAAVGLLVGGPAGGSILGKHEPLNWNGLWSFGGVTTCVGGILYVGIRIAKAGPKLFVKV